MSVCGEGRGGALSSVPYRFPAKSNALVSVSVSDQFHQDRDFCTCASEGTRVARALGLSDRCHGGQWEGSLAQCREPALLARAAHGRSTGTLPLQPGFLLPPA